MAKNSKKTNTAVSGTKPEAMKKPANVDDLKRISGVGPVLEKKLNGFGVYKYSQIAVWKKANVEWVDNFLNFPGRIDRDEWIAQCKAYAKEAAKAEAAASKASTAKSKPATKSAAGKKPAAKKPAATKKPTAAKKPWPSQLRKNLRHRKNRLQRKLRVRKQPRLLLQRRRHWYHLPAASVKQFFFKEQWQS